VKELWAVGQYRGETEGVANIAWDLQGVFETEQEAVDACRNENYFVGPVTLGLALPDDALEWPGCYYPLAGS
jgi:hypothetical protein